MQPDNARWLILDSRGVEVRMRVPSDWNNNDNHFMIGRLLRDLRSATHHGQGHMVAGPKRLLRIPLSAFVLPWLSHLTDH